MNVKIVHNPKEASGIAVIIDVFRAFSVEPYIINNGAKKLIPVGNKEIAYNLKEKNKEYVLIGERNGVKLPGFDYGNSPTQIENINFEGKVVIHTTSCGTQGIVNAINADEIITGSFVNASAIVKYIKQSSLKDVSLVSLARPGEEPFPEDQLFAEYIKALLENKTVNNLEERITELKNTSGAKFFDISMQEVFPKKDFYLCTEIDKFDFILKVEKDRDGSLFIKKVEV
ncbi:MAG: 2-phosphosulfolactate phosphatase [Clostridia bacterium]|jgi:2-phosphosulfolactate phosphatase|nr:2-phosphosulfolactate phosphatase [Clostridia bacterium]